MERVLAGSRSFCDAKSLEPENFAFQADAFRLHFRFRLQSSSVLEPGDLWSRCNLLRQLDESDAETDLSSVRILGTLKAIRMRHQSVQCMPITSYNYA